MLLGEHRRGDENRDLGAVLHRLECRADRHLRLSVAHVAADEPVHRQGRFHVALHFLDGAELIGGLIVREGGLQLALPRRVRGERAPAPRLPERVVPEQLLGHLLDGLARFRLRLLPRGAAEPRDERGATLFGRVALDHAELVDWNEEAIALRVVDLDALGVLPVERDPLQPPVDADPVVQVDHVLSGLERHEIADRGARRARPPAPAAPVPREDLVIREDREAGRREDEARRDRAHVDRDEAVPEDFLEALGLSAVVAYDDPLVAQLGKPAKLAAQEVELPAEGGLRARIEGDRRLLPVRRSHRDARFHAAKAREARERALRGIEQLLPRGQVRRLQPRVGLDPLGFALGAFQLARDRLGLIDPDRSTGREVLENRAERNPQMRGEPVHALEVDPLAHQLADTRGLQIAGERTAREGPEPFLEVLGEEDLPRGGDARAFDRSYRALRGDVEGAKRGDLVAVELDPHRVLHAGSEHIEEPAAAAHLAHFPHFADRPIACHDEPAGQLLGGELGPALEAHRPRADRVGRGGEPIEGEGRDDHDRRIGISEPKHRGHPVVADRTGRDL